MCGIYGMVGNLSQIDPAKILDSQNKSLTHRGPDDSGKFIQEPVAFGHSRLSIIDLEAGQQPMVFGSGQSIISYNGEIYNYLELRQELVKEGISFTSHSDTEVILAAYEVWGEDCVNRLNGMFSFALYDFKNKKLFCARDPYGQKPFFYFLKNNVFYFASEPRAFKHVPGFTGEIDQENLAHFLSFESFYNNRSIYREVKKIPAGHCLTFSSGSVTVQRYFNSLPDGQAGELELDWNSSLDRVDAALDRAVKIGCRSDVPVAMLLSGGLDSSLVLAYFRKNFPDNEIHSFHVQVDDPTYSEEVYARKVANQLGVKFNVSKLTLDELCRLAQTVPQKLDEPQADPGILPKYFISQEITKNFKVALTGDGGDELFYGYVIMKAQQIANWYQHVPDWFHQWVVVQLANLLPTRLGYMSFDFLVKRFIKGFPADEATRTYRWMQSFSQSDVEDLLQAKSETKRGTEGGLRFLKELYEQSRECQSLGRFAYRLQNTFLSDFVLCNSDRISMLHSLELRSPLLDVELARLTNKINDSYKMKGFRTKYLMKKVAERHLTPDVIYRKKVGFTVPIGKLLVGPLKEEFNDLFSESFLKKQGIFEHKTIQRYIDRHFSGKENLYKPLWTLYSLQKWILNE